MSSVGWMHRPRLTDANRQSLEATALVAGLQTELDRARQRLETLDQDSSTVQDELLSVGAAIDEARERLAAAETALAALEERRPGFRQEQDDLLLAYNGVRDSWPKSVVRPLRRSRSSMKAAGQRTVQQSRPLIVWSSSSGSSISGLRCWQRTSLQARLRCRSRSRNWMCILRSSSISSSSSASNETSCRPLSPRSRRRKQRRHELEKQVDAFRELVDGLRVSVRELEVRRETLAERFSATGIAMDECEGQLPENADAGEWDQRLQAVRASVERLGPINLAAISEFSEQSERKTYLDAQHADLTAALETLEHAIRRIDRETRTRFQETFDNINSGLKRLFPRLFGGGHAYLSLDGDDLLSAGVTVMARPPGKRNSHIHLLSGGEKALTAVALIFSIFELNPAPFCLLDEVDAPLDEANVNRFCDIVREMSRTVQFIVITHNKTTMEMARQLTGVTMNEPGVSRLVAVDIDEAVKLAAS